METKRHQGKTLQYLTVEPNGYDPKQRCPLVMLLHGFGASMTDLAGLTPAIDAEGYLYVFPNAPLPVQTGLGSVGYAWTPPRESTSPEDIEQAEGMLDVLLEEVMSEYDVAAGQIVLGGFSQGGMMTYRWGLTNPDLFAGLVVLSGTVPYPDTLRPRLPADRGQPLFIAHGTDDALISVAQAREALSFVEAAGYAPQYREYPMGHEISQAVIDDLVPWIRGVVSPFRPGGE